MNKYLILIAGSPCTGKTYLTNKIREVLPDLLLITPDDLKELYADSIGFDSLDEKSKLEKKVWHLYYQLLDLYMHAGKRIIVSEYPFSDKQKNRLSNLACQYHYHVITIRLIADFDILWQRRYKRDREPNRHLSHIVCKYHYGDQLTDRDAADNHISKACFLKTCLDRQYAQFKLGHLFEIDVSDFSKIDYTNLLTDLKKLIK